MLNYSHLYHRYCTTTPEQDEFCTESEAARREHSEEFMTNLITAAGRDQLKRSDIEQDIEDCLIGPCGGCSEAGIAFILCA